MSIYIVLATAFMLGAFFSFIWTKTTFEKQLQKTKTASDKQVENLLVDKIILEQRLFLINQEKASVNSFDNY